MNIQNHEKEARKQKRLETLGTNHPVCVICGEDDYRCLEQHHIAGRTYGDELATVCRNCHRRLSDDQKDHPNLIGQKPVSYEVIGHMLLGLADFLALLIAKLKEFGDFLIKAAHEAKA